MFGRNFLKPYVMWDIFTNIIECNLGVCLAWFASWVQGISCNYSKQAWYANLQCILCWKLVYVWSLYAWFSSL